MNVVILDGVTVQGIIARNNMNIWLSTHPFMLSQTGTIVFDIFFL